MTVIEQLAHKASHLDPAGLQALSEYLDFLLTRHAIEGEEPVFPESRFEDPDTPSVYRGKPLSLDQMRDAIDWEAGRTT